jgi:hypothetical protein
MLTSLMKVPAFVLSLVLILAACAEGPEPDTPAESAPDPALAPGELAPEQQAFWDGLVAHCGNSYSGWIDDVTPYYEGSTQYETIVADFRECGDERIHIAMHMDDDRSRNWILTREDGTILLKHDHRNEDGTEEEISQYGGYAPVPGLAHRQIFWADDHTADILPERWDNFWFMEFMGDDIFAYGVHWPEQGHSIRIYFDLSETVETPPAPWGY